MKLVIIGTGNVASALGKAFFTSGHTIEQVIGKSSNNVTKLAKRLKAEPVLFPDPPVLNADCYMIAVKDDAIPAVALYLKKVKGIVVHTSGSVPLSALGRSFSKKGVFYPVDTIKNNKPVSFTNVPVCIEGNTPVTRRKLLELAASVTEKTFLLDSAQRAVLHLAAVFSNNFTNHLHTSAFGILNENNLPTDLLHQLILSTARNAVSPGPEASQTGPAIRNDKLTIKAHRELLSNNKRLLGIYNSLTADITAHYAEVQKKQ
jgi:predicted short-subunit dehydrogenase-like oxidoreductase (DUF2520 family)